MDNTRKDFFLEIGTEEIPASMIREGLASLKKLFEDFLCEKKLFCKSIETYSTPRRIVLFINELSEGQEDQEIEVTGPAFQSAFDKEGNPTKAAEGFARAHNVKPSELIRKETPKGVCVAVRIRKHGRKTVDLFRENLSGLLSKTVFRKKMRWADFEEAFVRPVHWIMALYGRDVVDFQFAGVRSGNRSRGHRFLSNQVFTATDFSGFRDELKKRYVILDAEERKRIIREGMSLIEKNTECRVLLDPELLDEVANLVEFPVVETGHFDEKFLLLPREVIITALKAHQRYFAVENKNGKGLVPIFAIVHNNVVSDISVLNRGNERVLAARLSDAMFFFDEDLKKSLKNMVPNLEGRIFVKGLGNTYEKTLRVQRLVRLLAEKTGLDENSKKAAERAAYLCKADLISQMVFEFPELQGVMGMHYAVKQGDSEETGKAIFEHYLPGFAGDSLPGTKAGILLSIADKIDSLAGCFGIGLIPTGSEDPFALRRQAMGILNIMIEKPVIMKDGCRLSLHELIDLSIGEYSALEPKHDEILKSLLKFFEGRLFSLLVSRGIFNEFADAAICSDSGIADPFDTYCRAKAIEEFYKEHKEQFEPLIITFKRVGNILKNQPVGTEIREKLFIHESEKILYDKFRNISEEVDISRKREHYDKILLKMLDLKPFVDRFFDDVMVMVDDEALRTNRLNMLSCIRQKFYEFADFLRISTR
jgi:glycyl-tRNA synthetase beta chain